MCDLKTVKDTEEFLQLNRRDFGKASAAAGLSMMLPAVANAQELTESYHDIETDDGVADCFFVRPATGEHPAVLIWPDILGLRPAFEMMARRLAQSGYSVLVPNPFYRGARAPVVPEGASFQDPAVRETVFPLAGMLSADTHFTDARAFIQFLDDQDAVDSSRGMGTTGYCMGGPMVMRTMATSDRMRAGGTFHGGGLATDAENSPHLLIPEMEGASMLIAIAENDDQEEPEVKNILRDAFAANNIPAEIEVYPAQHGWCPPDMPVYDETQAERAWARLLNLFDNALA
ncbi:MAG: dienelactone hydrolase [Gammaproteobacteria bacterium]|nr:dienelactone hydrolase [Gammaproteobacteria bacterium]|tara:strand:- start:109718 stop:110581 length:864 start_codon:yes stop_codon:yes gene_type:complete